VKYLANKGTKNAVYLTTFTQACLKITKRSLNNCRVIVCLNSLYSLYDTLSKDTVSKIPKVLVKLIASSKNHFEKDMVLDLCLRLIVKSEEIKEKLAKYLDYFYLQISDKE